MERWQQIEEIFQAAVRLEPAQRDAYVSQTCRGDAELQREVLSLLANHEGGGASMSWAAAAAAQLIAGKDSLEPGKCLGPYRIDSFLAAGGMGEVYRGTDTRLQRQVAIKVSPSRFSERFETEARVIAALNHPNICQLYDVGPTYLVMELVEGITLAERIRRGPLPMAEVLGIARQIAEGLEAAHEKSRIHRDLKPANIKITPEGVVKLLDFGLAKTTEGASAAGDRNNSATVTISPTIAGTILGTPAYMSPEQARGSSVDKRTDIWAFGAVLYEMLSGKTAFAGETVSDQLAAVLHEEPDWQALPAATPRRIRRLLRRCLERDRKQRLRDIGEARIVIDEPEAEAAIRSPQRPLPWLVAGTLALALAGAVVGWWRAAQPPPLRPPMRLSIELGPEMALAKGSSQGSALAFSPDGSRLVFVTRAADGVSRLAMRPIDQSRSTLLTGTENAQDPFFSPSGDWIGFFADGKLKKVSIRGGAPVTLCVAAGNRGASWGDDDNIVASLNLGDAGLSRIPAGGGTPSRLSAVSGLKHNIQRWPQVLPGSHAVLFTAIEVGRSSDDANIAVLSFQTGQTKTVERGIVARYLPSGHLIFLRRNTLFAAPFDLDRMTVTASPQPVLDDIGGPAYSGAGFYGLGHFAFSQTGTFVYQSGTAISTRALFWLGPSGSTRPLSPERNQYYQPRFSPDGKSLAFAMGSENGIDIWVLDLERGVRSRRSFLPGRNWWPVWTPDGRNIVFHSASGGKSGIYRVRANGSGDAEPLPGDRGGQPRSFSPDGRLAFDIGNEIWTAPLEGDSEHPRLGAAERFADAGTPVPEAEFSPDGRWLAYVSAEQGIPDVFVRPFPGTGGRRQISTEGGHFPVWSRAGHQLFFLGPDQRIRVTDYTAGGDSFSPGPPRVWSTTPLGDLGVNSGYDLEPSGKRFAAVLDPEDAGASKPVTSVTVLLNFFDDLRRRVPPGK